MPGVHPQGHARSVLRQHPLSFSTKVTRHRLKNKIHCFS
jgi:hypothetical protein